MSIHLPPKTSIEPDFFVQGAYKNDIRLESSCFSADKWNHQQRFKKVLSRLKPGNILDVGCAEGAFSLPLAQEGWNVYGIDKYIGFLRYLKLKIQLNQITSINIVRGNGLALPFKDRVFDNVLLGEIIEHQARPELLLEEAKRVLRSGGNLIITTPLRPYYTTRSYFLREKYEKEEVYKNDGQPTAHVFEFTPIELDTLLKKKGFYLLYLEVFGVRIWEARMIHQVAKHLLYPLKIVPFFEKIILWLNNLIGNQRLPYQFRASTILAVAQKQY